MNISTTQQAEFENLAANFKIKAGYKWLQPNAMPSAIPDSLRNKMTSALLMWEQTSSGAIYIICNGVRIDNKDNALDQEPFGIVVHSSGSASWGLFLHHGNWKNRTIKITSEITQILESTSLDKYFPLGEVPVSSSGPLNDLKNTSHAGAFRTVIKNIISSST